MKGGALMEYEAVVKVVEKVSKNNNPYSVIEIYINGKLVKGGIFLNDAEKTLLEILG